MSTPVLFHNELSLTKINYGLRMSVDLQVHNLGTYSIVTNTEKLQWYFEKCKTKRIQDFGRENIKGRHRLQGLWISPL
jgi:hypothetical protein